jgi:hypothetical protein
MATTGPSRDRGSRKHILDLVSAQDFVGTINSLLLRTGFQVGDLRHTRPTGRSDADHWKEFRVENYLEDEHHRISAGGPFLDRSWWISHGGNRPNWDMISQITGGHTTGILLVEAKAHEREMSEQNTKSPPEPGNQDAKENDEQIRRRIHTTNTSLNRLGLGTFRLSADNHYQLANRLAYTIKLSSLGIPVVLIYLGFIEDSYFKTDHFRSPEHWQRVIGGYLQGVVPQSFPDQIFTPKDGGAKFGMLIRSLKITDVSRR